MADFNKIFVNSNVTIINTTPASLCFGDNKLISKSKYALANGYLELTVDNADTITIYNNNGVGNLYEFNSYLYASNTSLPKLDNTQQEVVLNTKENTLVFIEGKLQPIDTYTIADNILTITKSYTNDINKIFDIYAYSNTTNIIRYAYTLNEILNISLESISLPNIIYDINNTMIFINGLKVPFNKIEVLNDANTIIKLNIDTPISEITEFEIIKLSDTNTISYNFIASSGYLTYGPYDAFNKKLQDNYNIIFKFQDQVKLLVDNIRPGFIIKEAANTGEAVIIDTNFETTEVKALIIQPFAYSNLSKDTYYLEVPTCTNITKYLAKFDNRYTFLPEILSIFQRLLLDEIHDEIQRLRDMRSIHKVDSVNINNLISLLGFDANIKTLTNKQRHELLEELDEFYRIVGTRNSYNLLNILQNDLKLINMEQLFTPYGNYASKKSIYNYSSSIKEGNGGIGYKVGDYLKANIGTTDIPIVVTEVDENGSIIPGMAGVGYTQETSEGYGEVTGDFPLQSGIVASMNISTPTNYQNYHYSIVNSTNYIVGQELTDSLGKYKFRITSTDAQGTITDFEVLPPSPAGGNQLEVSLLPLYVLNETPLSLDVKHYNLSDDPNDYIEDLVKAYTLGGESFELSLTPGVYYIEAAGAGGAGGAADSRTGNEYDWPASNGANGELKTMYFTLTSDSTITGKVGQGGGRVKARGHDSVPYNEVLGSGFSDGLLGGLKHIDAYQMGGLQGRVRGNIAGGQGGGSSGIRLMDNSVLIEARGGNGGGANTPKNISERNGISVNGGLGGGGGVTGGQGGAGGSRAYGGDFWSKCGSDGWIKIYRVKQRYEFEVIGNTSGVSNNDQFNIINPPFDPVLDTYLTFTSIATINPSGVTFETTPTEGYLPLEVIYPFQHINANVSAKLNIRSEFEYYIYEGTISTGQLGYIRPGDVFKTVGTTPEFTYTVTSVDNSIGKIRGGLSPNIGRTRIELMDIPINLEIGSGGILSITSAKNTQKNEDRCYIDFYTKQELGAISHKEYRVDSIDYGYVNEGTPNSPKFWEAGDPDIDYGLVSEIATETLDYGYVNQKVKGEWVEWWEWNRQSLWYPTNHVQLELKLPNGVNLEDYSNTFIEQFYNIASTVLFIHSIIESFYFGLDITESSGSSGTENNGGSLGIMTGSPVNEIITTVTSDPTIQYVETIQPEYTFTVDPMPTENINIIPNNLTLPESTVTFINGGLIIKRDTGKQSVTVPYGSEIFWKVEAPGYHSKFGTCLIDKDKTKYPILEKIIEDDQKYCTFTLIPNIEDAEVILQAPDYPTITKIGTTSIQVLNGTKVKYSVSKEGYTTIEGVYLILDNGSAEITLQ